MRHQFRTTLLLLAGIVMGSNTLLAQSDDVAPIKLRLAEWLSKEFAVRPAYQQHRVFFDATPLGKILNADTLSNDHRPVSPVGISDLSRQVGFTMKASVAKLIDTFKCREGAKFCEPSEDMIVQIGEPMVVQRHATIVYQLATVAGNATYQRIKLVPFVMDLERDANGSWKSQRVRLIQGNRPTVEVRPVHSATN